MSDGLKHQWDVGEPAQVGPDAQSQDLKAVFEKLMDAMSEDLQFTAVNGEQARHGPLASRRDALVPRYQAALAEVVPADPTKAQSSIDALRADTEALGKDVAAFRSETEKATAEWQSRVAAFDAAVVQVEEIEAWQHPKEGALRSLVDAIRSLVNDRALKKAIAVLDQFLPNSHGSTSTVVTLAASVGQRLQRKRGQIALKAIAKQIDLLLFTNFQHLASEDRAFTKSQVRYATGAL